MIGIDVGRKKGAKTVNKSCGKKITLVAVLSMALMLTSCSIVEIHFDSILEELFPFEGTFADEGGTDADDMISDGEETEPDTKKDITVHEYTGLAEATAYLDQIGEYSFDEQTVFIKTTATAELDMLFVSEDLDENDTYSASIYERNRMVEERFGCELHYVVTTVDQMIIDITAAVETEEYYADLLAVTQKELALLVKENCVYNLRQLPFFSLEEEYFNSYGASAFSAGYSDYGVVGAATINPDNISCVFANLDLLNEIYEGDVETLAKSGQWTWDVFMNIASGFIVSSDHPLADDGGLTDIVSASAGLSMVNNKRNETPAVVLADDAATVVDVCQRLFSEITLITSTEEAEGIDCFVSGETLFHLGSLGDMNALAVSGFDWTVLPVPKMTSEDEYRAYVSDETLVLAVPVNTVDPDGASVLLRAVSAASAGYLRDAYVDYHHYNTVSHSGVLELIELIYETPYFCFDNGLGTVSERITACTFELIREAVLDPELNVTKQFGKREDKANDKLEDYFAPRN